MRAISDFSTAGTGSHDPAAPRRGRAITTRSVPKRERLDYWHDAVLANLVGMDISTGAQTYDASMWTDHLGDVQITTVECDPGVVDRTAAAIARGDGHSVFVTTLSTGRAQIEQDGRSIELRPGDFAFFETVRPSRTRFPERFRMKIFVVPRGLLGISEAELQRLTARALRPTHGVTALLAPFMDRLADTSTTYDAAAAARLAQSMTGLLAATAADHLGLAPADVPGSDRVLLLRIKTFILYHLSDPDLSLRRIALEHGISVRYLHQLFGDEGTTVGRWIRELRLRECRTELAAGCEAAGLGLIARRWGFSGAAHFSRVFRGVYGVSPTEWLQRLAEQETTGEVLWES
jgi:AraC-like DNA-binding protein